MCSKFHAVYDQHSNRDGEEFSLVKVIDTPDESHDAEVLPMYLIRFNDGQEIEAWPEEIM